MPFPASPFQEKLRRLTFHIMHRLMGGMWKHAKEQGLSMTQVFILRQVQAQQGGCNVSMISEEMGVSNAAISQTLEHLVQQGYILRAEDPQDRRNKRIRLTDKGAQLLETAMEARQQWAQEMEERLSESEKALVTQAFDILLVKMEQE